MGSTHPTLRHRIVEDSSFDFPIRITDAVEIDESGAAQKLFEVSAYAANQVILHSPSEIEQAEVADIARSLGWTQLNALPSNYLAVLETETTTLDTVREAIVAIQLSNSQLSAEPNYIVYAALSPNDPEFVSSKQWALESENDVDINAPEGWDIRRTAPNKVVAILDTGIRPTHEDLAANLWRKSGSVYGYNFVSTSKPPIDDNGHGTHVAGILGAVGNNSKGISGVAWDIQLMALKCLNAEGKGTTSALASAIDYATNNGAHIINASLGTDSYSETVDAAILRAQRKGIPFVAAAGNEQSNTIPYPASSKHENVISVGGANKFGGLYSETNYSSQDVDVIAPAEDIYSAWNNSDSAYEYSSGTSMATPIVSGMLALCQTQFPNEDLQEQLNRVIYSSKRIEYFENYARSGGRVNLGNALSMLSVPSPPQLISVNAYLHAVDEGGSVSFSVEVEDTENISFAWRHNDETLSSTTASLTLDAVTPEDRGTYTLEISNTETSITLNFELAVFPRMTEIEELLAFESVVFASHEDHWAIVQEDGNAAIVNRALDQDEV
ncbi:MAG: S8 family serine peptidase, partial [Verrucomicrobiota bacterium]